MQSLIRAALPVHPIPGVPDVLLHLAGPGSRIGRLAGVDGSPPYWAYAWAGGIALARYILDVPEAVRGLTVLDVGAGSGLVGIAAAKAGAARVLACDSDGRGRAAAELNAQRNGVRLDWLAGGVEAAEGLSVDCVLAGDVFYDPRAARAMTGFLDRCVGVGIPVLVGDPWRADLPTERLVPLAEYRVRDFGDGDAGTRAGVFRWTAAL